MFQVLPWLVAISFFMQTLDTSILNTALPAIAEDLHTSPLQMQAIIISYMLTVALIIPTSGWLTDRFGARRIFLAAIALFTLGSLTCALSPTLELLTASRVLQGIGGALMVPVGRLAVLRAFPRDQLVRVLGLITIPGLIGPLLGPPLGGFLAHYASWHWIFLINIPVGIAGFLLSLRYMPELPATDAPGSFDWIGFVLFSLFMIAITVSIDGVGELHFSSAYMGALGLFGLFCFALYCLYARKAANPLFSPALFHIRNFRVGIIGNLFARLGNGAIPFLTPLLLQVGLGYSPVKSGLTMLPIAMGAMLAKSIVGRLLKIFGYRWFLCLNTLLMGVVIAAYSMIDASTPYLAILLLFICSGIVNSLQFTSMNSLTLLDLPNSLAGSGNSLLSATMQMGMGMGVACAATILDLNTSSGQELLPAFRNTYLAIGAIGAISSLIFFQARNTKGYGCC